MLHKNYSRFLGMSGLLGVLLFGAFYLHLTNGMFDLSVQDIVKTLFRIDPEANHDLVIFEFRLPRIIIALLAGAGLGIAGAVTQAVTRNDLADPGILGINAGAGTAIVLFMFFVQFAGGAQTSESLPSIFLMPLSGFVGGLAAAVLIYLFAWKNGKLDRQMLILTGIAISSGFGAVTLFISLKMNADDYESAAVWLSGSIYHANWPYIAAAAPWIIVLSIVIYSRSRMLDYFQLSEETAIGLGIRVEREKAILLLSSIGLVSACVSVSGGIGFLGLIAPHIAKKLVGLHHQFIIPISAIIGMVLLVFSDYLAKTIFQPSELSVGIVVAIIGIPYFLYLLLKEKK